MSNHLRKIMCNTRYKSENITKNFSSQMLIKGAVTAILVVNFGFLLWYLFFGYQQHFHSDSAVKVLLAREIYDTGEFFPKNWNYANNDLFIIFGHIAIIPLLNWLPAGYIAHAVSGVIFASMILCAIWLLLKSAGIATLRVLMIVAAFAGGISDLFAENLFGQVSYGPILLICCFILLFTNRFLAAENKSRIFWLISLSTIIFVAFWSNPKRALVSYELPLIASLTYLFFFEFKNRRKDYICLALISVVGMVLGTLAHIITLTEAINVRGAADALWLDIDQVPKNILFTLEGLYAQIGGLLLAGSDLLSIAGLSSALRFILATAILILMPVSIRYAVRTANLPMQNIALFSAASFALMTFFQISTTIPDQSNMVGSSRYLVPSVALCLMVLLSSPLDWLIRPIQAATVLAVLLMFLSGGYNNFSFSTPRQQNLENKLTQLDIQRNLLHTLLENGLHYGYASYWNAGVLSVLSDEKVKVRQIILDDGLPMPHRHLSSNEWYRPSAWEGNTFLLLQKSERFNVDLKAISALGIDLIREIKIGDFWIFIFDKNIANAIPGWDSTLEKPLAFLPSEDSFRQVGHFVRSTQTTGPAVVAEEGQRGALSYGPYIDIDPGEYRVTFEVDFAYNAESAVTLDISSSPDQNILGELKLFHSNGPQVIEFTLSERKTLEFRVWVSGTQRVLFSGVTIERILK